MIPNCQSLEEAITHVTDPAVKEELEYQYDKHKELLNKGLELESLQDDYDDLKRDYLDLQDEYDAVEERADEYESDAESYQTMASILRDISGRKLCTTRAQEILNSLLKIMGSEKCEVTNLVDPCCDEVISF